MRKFGIAVLTLAVITPSLLLAADAFDGTPKNFSGAYLIYGGELGDWSAPTTKDAKLYLEIKGDAARKIFAQLPKAKVMCEGTATEARAAGDLQCVKDEGQFVCYLGYDLKKGKSANALIC